MSALAEKIRKARESNVEAGGFVFTIRRPTDMEMLAFSRSRRMEDLVRHVVGWDKVREMDLIPGGDPHPLPFDAEACSEWLLDRSDLLAPLVEKILAAYEAHKKKQDDAVKN